MRRRSTLRAHRSIPPNHEDRCTVLLANRGRNLGSFCYPDLVRSKGSKKIAQLVQRNIADHKCRVREGPRTFARVEFGYLYVNGLDSRALKETGKDVAESGDAGVVGEIAPDGARIVVAVEEAFDGKDLRLGLCSQVLL